MIDTLIYPICPTAICFIIIKMFFVFTLPRFLAAFVGLHALNNMGSTRNDTAQILIAAFTQELAFYRPALGRPPSDEGLNALLLPLSGVANWGGPYLSGTTFPNDPWQSTHIYHPYGISTEFTLYSFGSDNPPCGISE